MKIVLAALLAFWVMGPENMWAGAVSVENSAGRVICELRLPAPDGPGWRENLLSGPCLPPAAVTTVTFPDTGRANLLAVFEDGDYLVYQGLELGGRRYLTLGPDEAEFFEWNPAADK